MQFTRVGPGLGAYQDSSVVNARVVFAFVGQGNGAYRIGRALPLADSHQLWAMTGGGGSGPFTVDLEGAVSRHDLNTFSTLDDNDNVGGAGRARVALAGRVPGALGGAAGLELLARAVGRKFDPFARLERPFEQEDWGLPLGADLERQARVSCPAPQAADRQAARIAPDTSRRRSLRSLREACSGRARGQSPPAPAGNRPTATRRTGVPRRRAPARDR